MGCRIRLEDGKLYENVDGERFRVKWNAKLRRFECLAANQAWGDDGVPVRASNPDGYIGCYLVREIPEFRWVSIHEEGITNGMVVMKERGHWYRQVTRDEARRLAPNYKQAETVYNKIQQMGAEIESVKEGNKLFLRITTPAGKVVIVEV